MKYKEIIIKTIAEFCRLLIGVVFVFSGFVKAIDPMGFIIKIDDYLGAFGMDSLRPLAIVVAFFLIALEFILGISLLLGVYRKYVSLLTLAFMMVMTPLTLYLAIFNPVTDCGCFGDALIITNWQTFFKNAVLLSAVIFLLFHNRKLFSIYTPKTRWFVPLFAFLYCILFASWNYNHLPFIDFRPYKVGVNIPEQMHIPEGAPEDEYRYSFIYEKDGVKKEFSLDNYPENDSSWTFVESKTTLVKKGYAPPITSFNIFSLEGNDVSDLLLENPDDLFLLIAPHLEDASDERIDEITNIYEYTLAHHTPFFCVTGSSPEAIQPWIERTGAEYPFLQADDVLLKTIIRSNPGLVWLRNGTIMMKWHYKDLPSEDEIDALLTGKETVTKGKGWILMNMLTFTLPLLLVWLYDYWFFRRKRQRTDVATTE
ncbi:hypothetical protein AGMMS49574_25250 [Bacteroidia bacterium]|nr:hypothetical protein AGMMS49574_25250 [Bacteroidia bacterium]